jgi:hypothetical protein
MAARVVEKEVVDRRAPVRSRTFQLDEIEQVIQDIISTYELGYTEVTYERAQGEVKFVKLTAVFKIEPD